MFIRGKGKKIDRRSYRQKSRQKDSHSDIQTARKILWYSLRIRYELRNYETINYCCSVEKGIDKSSKIDLLPKAMASFHCLWFQSLYIKNLFYAIWFWLVLFYAVCSIIPYFILFHSILLYHTIHLLLGLIICLKNECLPIRTVRNFDNSKLNWFLCTSMHCISYK